MCVCVCVFWGLQGEKGRPPGNSVTLLGDLCIPHRLKIHHVQLCLKGFTGLIQKDTGMQCRLAVCVDTRHAQAVFRQAEESLLK